MLFFNIVSLYFNTLFNWYINLTIDGTIYPSQCFPFGAAFVCQAGNVWTLLRTRRTWVKFNIRGFQNPTKVSGTASAHCLVSYCWQWHATWQQKSNSLLLFHVNTVNIYIAESDMCYATMHRPKHCCISYGTCFVTVASFFRATISSGYLKGLNGHFVGTLRPLIRNTAPSSIMDADNIRFKQ